MSMPCPPAPNYVREQGIADCDYLQTTPFVRQRMQQTFDSTRRAYDPNGNQTYSIGGYPMKHSHMGATPRVFGTNGAHMHGAHMGAVPRVFGTKGAHMHGAHMHGAHMGATPRVFGLGRSVLDVGTAKGYNSGSASVKPASVGQYGNTSSDAFIKDLWSAQVIALWTSNGNVYRRYEGMQGIIERNGHNPADLSPLGIGSDGVVTSDLRPLLNDGSASRTLVKGPDGMLGESADSLIAEWVGTGKLFGKTITGNAAIALNRLGNNISTPLIDAAKAARTSGNPPVPKTETAPTPCDQLIPEARAARSDCPQTPGGSGTGGGTGGDVKPKAPAQPSKAAEKTDWVLWGGIGAAVLVVGGAVGYYYYTANDSSSEI